MQGNRRWCYWRELRTGDEGAWKIRSKKEGLGMFPSGACRDLLCLTCISPESTGCLGRASMHMCVCVCVCVQTLTYMLSHTSSSLSEVLASNFSHPS